jgi:hypothetical protein
MIQAPPIEDRKLPDWQFEQRLGPVKRVDRFAFLMERARNKKVLHLGCADSHLHRFLNSTAGELWGVDLAEDRIEDMRRVGWKNVFLGDVEQLERIPQLRNQHFDVIIAGEIIEHLNNPGMFLNGCRYLAEPKTEIIITTPNALMYSLPIFAMLNREAVHPDHTFYWTPATFRALIGRSGLEVREFYVYGDMPCVQMKAHEPLARRSARMLLRVVDAVLRNTVVRWCPWLNNGLIVVAKGSPHAE